MNYEFYGITTETKTGKTLYLKCSEREAKSSNKILMDWTFNADEACLWNTYSECIEFAKSYFKTFSNYNVKSIDICY